MRFSRSRDHVPTNHEIELFPKHPEQPIRTGIPDPLRPEGSLPCQSKRPMLTEAATGRGRVGDLRGRDAGPDRPEEPVCPEEHSPVVCECESEDPPALPDVRVFRDSTGRRVSHLTPPVASWS